MLRVEEDQMECGMATLLFPGKKPQNGKDDQLWRE